MTDQKHIPPVTPKNFVVRYKASVERAFKNADVKFLSMEDDKWERLMESLSAEANKLLANFQPPPPSPQTGEKDNLSNSTPLTSSNSISLKPPNSGELKVVEIDHFKNEFKELA